MTTYSSTLSAPWRKASNRIWALVCGGGAVTALAVWVATSPTAAILQQATHTQGKGNIMNSGTDIFDVVNRLLGPALIVVVALAPLAIAWGAGMMIFGGKHGPQIMASSIVAVVLVAAAKGIAL